MDDNFSTDLYAHAPWRPKRNGSLSPEIYQSKALDSIKSLGVKRVILSACDYHFFERYSQNVLDYEASDCQIIYTLGVFSSKDESVLVFEKLLRFCAENRLKKFFPFVYGSSNLEWILSQQRDAEIKWDYKINYIRRSRYNLITQVWKALGISVIKDCSIRDSSTYVIDFDNEIRGDLNHAIKGQYSSHH